MRFGFYNGFALAFVWIVVSLTVFTALDALATREVPLHVEDFRRPEMTDEEVVTAAVQEAFRIEKNHWWIHDKQPYLVFDASRTYHFDPDGYTTFRLEIRSRSRRGTIGLLRARSPQAPLGATMAR